MDAKLDALLQDFVDAGHIPGLAAVVCKDGKVVYDKQFGQQRAEGGKPLHKDSSFRIMSMTKMVTSVAALQLLEKGHFTADTPLSDLLPDFKDLKYLKGFDADGKPQTVPAPRQPTVREVASHSSSLAYDWWSPELAKYYAAEGLPTIFTFKRASVYSTPLLFEPGSDWLYGVGIDCLGFIVEKVSGQTLGEYVKANIFEPLGMKSSFYGAVDAEDPNFVPIHLRSPDDKTLTELPMPMPADADFEMGGGGITSTLTDYAKFMNDIISDSPKVLKRETIDEYVRKNHLKEGVTCKVLPAAYPYSNEKSFIPGKKITHSMACAITEDDVPGMRPAGSLAWAGLLNSYFWIDPKNNITAAIGTQLLPFVDNKVVPLFEDFEKTVYAHH